MPKRTQVVAVAVGASVMGDAMLYAVLPTSVSSFGLQVGLLGVILSINRFIRLLSNNWAGAVYARVGIFWPFVTALTIGGLITGAYSLAHGFWILALLRTTWGVCWSFLRLGGYLTALEEEEPGLTGWFMGILNTGFRGGQLVGALLGAFLADLLGHAIAFSFLTLLTGAGLILTVIGWGPQRRSCVTLTADANQGSFPGLTARTNRSTTWDLLISHVPEMDRQQRYRLLAINCMRFSLGLGVEGLLVASLGLVLNEVFGNQVNLGVVELGIGTATGAMLAFHWSSDLTLSALVGHLSDRFGQGLLLAVCFPALVLGLPAVGFVNRPLSLLLVLPFVFIASTTYGVVLDAAAGDSCPRSRRARVMSRYTTWRDLGAALGPALGYGIGVITGFSWMYLLAALLFVLSGILYMYSQKIHSTPVVDQASVMDNILERPDYRRHS